VLGLLLARRHPTVEVTGVELSAAAARHAAANARANGLEARVRIVRGDLRDAPRFLPPEHFHRVVANPPFRRPGTGAVPPDPERARARLELGFTLDDLARTAAALVRFGGALELIHLAERLPELCTTLCARGLEPKRLRLVTPFAGGPPRLCLLSAVKGARPGLRLLPELVLDGEAGKAAGDGPAHNRAEVKKRQVDQ
jgi:tRNA1(Val) A37 N6-methylase TrmN6